MYKRLMIVIFIVMFSFNATSQDTSVLPQDSVWKQILSSGAAKSYGMTFYTQPKEADTVKVWMLYCNTELQEYNGEQYGIPYTYKDFDNSVKWMYGYRVKDSANRFRSNYLDLNKNRLKSTVVWMSMDVK